MLNAQQSEAVKTVEGPVLLLAVPGSGKTTVLVLRLGYMILNCGIAPENILTVTYTVAATQDMAKRFAGYFGGELAARLEFRTINGICAKIIAYYSRAIGKKPFELVTDEKSTAGILTQIYQQVEQNWPTEADLRNVRTLITYIKNQMLTEKEIKALRKQKGSPLRAADRFIQKNTLRHAKHMVCADGAAEGPEVREVVLKTRRAQYYYLLRVADGCEEETAVLYRNNESAIPVVDLLERNNVPYRIRNAEVGFFTHRTVMDISNIIKLAYDPRDVDAFMAVYYKLGLYLNKETASLVCDLSRRLGMPVLETAIRYADLKPMTLKSLKSIRTHLENMKEERGDQAVSRIVRHMGYGEYLSNAGIRDSKVYILKALGVQTESPSELLDRIGYLEDIFRGKESDPDCPFILSTIHASKGLEYDTVYLMDVVNGLFPEEVPVSMKYMQPDERRVFEEERRLFYVGMTRAQKRLCVFTTEAKSVLADELFGREKVRKR